MAYSSKTNNFNMQYLKNMIIKDPLYGFITIEKPFLDLMEDEHFQRLRNIKQLGLSYLVYYSANHTRFEHSVGTYYLATKIAENNGIENRNEFIAAALLHDIGHYPFSHAIEKTIKAITGIGHEEQGIEIIRNSCIAEKLKKLNINVDNVCDFIEGRGKYSNLIAGDIDADRLDYLKRDSYYTGVAYGIVESDVIINSFHAREDDCVTDIKYLPAVESVLISRYLMYSMVYMHHRTIIANAMLRCAFVEALENGDFTSKELTKFDDIDLISKLRSSKSTARLMMENITKRNLYKEAAVFKKEDFEDTSKIADTKKILEVEKRIAKEMNLKNHEILINALSYPKESNNKILISPSMQSLEEISPIVSSLNQAEWNYWFVGVYSKEKYVEKLAKEKDMIKSYLIE